MSAFELRGNEELLLAAIAVLELCEPAAPASFSFQVLYLGIRFELPSPLELGSDD